MGCTDVQLKEKINIFDKINDRDVAKNTNIQHTEKTTIITEMYGSIKKLLLQIN